MRKTVPWGSSLQYLVAVPTCACVARTRARIEAQTTERDHGSGFGSTPACFATGWARKGEGENEGAGGGTWGWNYDNACHIR